MSNTFFVYDYRLKRDPPGKFFDGKDHGTDIIRKHLEIQNVDIDENITVKIIRDPYDHEFPSYDFVKGIFVPHCFSRKIENEDVQIMDYGSDLSDVRVNSQGKILCYGVWIDMDIHRDEIKKNFGWRNRSENGIDIFFIRFTSFFHLPIQNNVREVGVVFHCDPYYICDQKKDAIDKYQEHYQSWLQTETEILGMLIQGDHVIGDRKFDLIFLVDTVAELKMFYTDICITTSRDKFDNAQK